MDFFQHRGLLSRPLPTDQTAKLTGIQHPIAVTITACVLALSVYFQLASAHTLQYSILLIIITSILLITLYRLTLHPLADYPGPGYTAISEAYNIFSCLNGERHLQFKIWHDRYGPVVRYAPNRLSFCDEKAISDIYGVRANTQKSQMYGGFNHVFNATSSLTCTDRKEHTFKRRAINNALQPAQLKIFEKHLTKNMDILTNDVLKDASSSDWSSPHDLSTLIHRLLTDMIGDVVFSKSWNVQISPTKRWIEEFFPLATSGVHAAGHMLLALKLNLQSVFLPRTMASVYQWLAVARSQCEERIQREESMGDGKDLFSSLLRVSSLGQDKPQTKNETETETEISKDIPAKSLGMNDLVAETAIMIVAGADTTTTALTATLFYLLMHPSILHLVRQEIDATFPSPIDSHDTTSNLSRTTIENGASLSSCKLLRACIDEALRLSPPGPGLFPREVLAGGLLVADKWYVPAGVDVGVPIYAVQRDARYWREAHTFDPFRWLLSGSPTSSSPASESETGLEIESKLEAGLGSVSEFDLAPISQLQDHHNTFMPFNFGRTSCVGKHLAYNAMSVTLARILKTFDLEMESGSQVSGSKFGKSKGGGWGRGNKEEFQVRDVFSSAHQGPVVRFRRR